MAGLRTRVGLVVVIVVAGLLVVGGVLLARGTGSAAKDDASAEGGIASVRCDDAHLARLTTELAERAWLDPGAPTTVAIGAHPATPCRLLMVTNRALTDREARAVFAIAGASVEITVGTGCRAIEPGC